jgi:hypothetical protein
MSFRPSLSKFCNTDIVLNAQQAAVVTIGASLIGGLMKACTTGSLSGFTDTAEVAADIADQSVRHPQKYNSPKFKP